MAPATAEDAASGLHRPIMASLDEEDRAATVGQAPAHVTLWPLRILQQGQALGKVADGIGHAEMQVTLKSHIEMFGAQHRDLEMPREGPC